MTIPEVKVRASLEDDGFRKAVGELAGVIQQQIGQAFSSAVGQSNTINQFSSALKDLTNAANQLSGAIKTTVGELGKVGDKSNDAKDKTENLSKTFARFFANALKGANSAQKFTQAILKQSVSAGAGAGVITDLAAASGVFSARQIELASTISALQIEIKELSKDANKNEDAFERLSEVTDELTDAQIKLEKELNDTQSALKETAKAEKFLADIEKNAESIRSKRFATSLKAVSAEQKFTKEILNQVAAAGAALPLLQRLALASDTFTREEVEAATAVAKLTAELEKQARVFDGTIQAENELINKSNQLVSAQKRLSDIQDRSSKSQDKLNKTVGSADKFFTPLQSGIARLNNVMAGLRNVVDIVDKTFIQLFRTAKEGAVIQQTADSFDSFATNIAGIPDLLAQLDEEAQNTISTFDLQKETLTLVAGLGPELSRTFSEALVGAGDFDTSLLDVARAAQLLNPALGDVDFFLKSLSIGIKRNERRWIDNLGIVISAREAYQRFAEANNKSVLELTATDKQLATLNETLRVGQLLVNQTADGAESLVDPFKRVEASVQNLTDSWKTLIGEALLPWVQLISGDLGQGVEDSFDGIVDKSEDAKQALFELARAALELQLSDLDLGPLETVFAGTQLEDQRQKQIRKIISEFARISADEQDFLVNVGVAFEGDEQQFTNALRKELISLRSELGDEALLDEGLTFAPISGVPGAETLEETAAAFFRLIFSQNIAKESAQEVTNVTKQQIEEFQKLKVAIDEVALKFREQQLSLTEDLFKSGLEESERSEIGKQLAESFREQFIDGLEAGGVSELGRTAVKVLLGELDEGALEATQSTQELNDEIANLNNLLARRNVSDPDIIASSFLALELGFAGSADEAFRLANNTEFVTNVLIPAQKAAEEAGESLGEIDEGAKKANEALQELRETLSGIVEQGFDRATDAIKRFGEAQRGIAETSGVERTVQINNSRRIAEIEEELLSDLPDDRREELDKRLEEIRNDGDDFTSEYANILREIGTDLSRTNRDELLIERAELLEQQGQFVTAVFGRDKQALEKFEDDAQQAIQDLIENRRQTVFELLTEGRDVGFETEVELALNFGLIDDLEAELLIKERQIFDLIDQFFGVGSVFQVGEKVIDFGEISVSEFTPTQISILVESFENAVSLGLGEEAEQLVDLSIKLALAGEVDTSLLPLLISASLDRLADDPTATVEQAIIVSLVPEIDTTAQAQAIESGERVRDLFLGEDDALTAPTKSFNQMKESINRVNDAIVEVKDNDEVEVEIIADTDGAIAAINDLLDIIPEQVTIEVNADVAEEFRTPRSGEIEGAGSVAPEPQSSGNREGFFRHGGFTGSGNPNSVAGVVEHEEFVFDQNDVQTLGVPSLESLRDGTASIVPNTTAFSQDTVSAMLDAISNPLPTLTPAAISNKNTTNRTMTIDQSTTIVNNFFDRASADVVPVMDIF